MDLGPALSSISAGLSPDTAITGTPKVTPIPGDTSAVGGAAEPTFRDSVKAMLSDVNDKVVGSDKAARDLATGKSHDLNKAVTSIEEANLAMQFTLSVRNKLLEAYQEIQRMQV